MFQSFDLVYFGNLNYYKNIVNSPYVYFELYKNHQKSSYLNRCRIAAANGPILLSIPLEKGRMQSTIIREIRISNDIPWQSQHWKSLASAYNSSPWFFHFKDSLSGLFHRHYTFLIDWNLDCLEWLLHQLRIDLQYKTVMEQAVMPPGTSNSGDNSYLGSGAPEKKDQDHEIVYHQVFESRTGFIPGLSILDPLFCEGPKTTLRMLQGTRV